MRKAVLFGHFGSENHGCEALVRSTEAILRESGMADIALLTKCPEVDRKYMPDFSGEIISQGEPFSGITPGRIAAKVLKSVSGSYALYDRHEMKSLMAVRDSICLSIGGDNYCYSDFERYMRMNYYLCRHGNSTVFWGCSVEPELLKNRNVLEDMRRFSLITARESLTYDALLCAGIENVMFCPDSAFRLVPEETELPPIFEKDTVGINISPLVLSYGKEDGMIMENYRALIEFILSSTDMNIAFIPHVVSAFSDDLVVLRQFYDSYSSTGRVCLMDKDKKLNACQLKYIISKCRFMVTARTHASIAAYSSGVPALVAGYSVKAKGIAKDIFGSYENYVCPVQTLKSERDLLCCFEFITANEASIKNSLSGYMQKTEHCFSDVSTKLRAIAKS